MRFSRSRGFGTSRFAERSSLFANLVPSHRGTSEANWRRQLLKRADFLFIILEQNVPKQKQALENNQGS